MIIGLTIVKRNKLEEIELIYEEKYSILIFEFECL
jgi:hypothetical protein